MLKVEKNLPIPSISRARKKPSLKTLVETMKVGDSILLPDNNKAQYMWRIMKSLGFESTQRVAKGGVRVWRTK